MLPIPTRLQFFGNTHAAKEFKRFALTQLEILKRQMSFQGLKQGVRRITPFPGVLIECTSKFGNTEIKVYVQPTNFEYQQHQGNVLEKRKINKKITLDKYFIFAKAGDKTWSILLNKTTAKLTLDRKSPPVDFENIYEFTQVRYTENYTVGMIIVSAISICINDGLNKITTTSFYSECGIPSLKTLQGSAAISINYDEIYQVYLGGNNKYVTKCYIINAHNDEWELKNQYNAPYVMTPISKAMDFIYHRDGSVGRDGITTTFLVLTSVETITNTWINYPVTSTEPHPCVVPSPAYPTPMLATETYNETEHIYSSTNTITTFNSINARNGSIIPAESYRGLALLNPNTDGTLWDFSLVNVGRVSTSTSYKSHINGYCTYPWACYYWNRLDNTDITSTTTSSISNIASQITYANKTHSETSYIPILSGMSGYHGDQWYLVEAEFTTNGCHQKTMEAISLDTRTYKSDLVVSNSSVIIKVNKSVTESEGTATYIEDYTGEDPCIPPTGVSQFKTLGASAFVNISFYPESNQINSFPDTITAEVEYSQTNTHVDINTLDFPFVIEDIEEISKSFISTDQYTNITFFGVKYNLRSNPAVFTWKVAVCFDGAYLDAIDVTDQLRDKIKTFDDDFEMIYFYGKEFETEVVY